MVVTVTADPHRQSELGEELLWMAHVVLVRVLEELMVRLVDADAGEMALRILTVRQEPRRGIDVQSSVGGALGDHAGDRCRNYGDRGGILARRQIPDSGC